MQLINSGKFLGNNKITIGDLSSDMVLQTLGKIYIQSGKNLKLLTDITSTIATADSSAIVVNSEQELNNLEYPGDGRFIYNTGNSILYLSYKDRYIALIEVTGTVGNYVKKTGDTMSGTLEVATSKVPFIVHSRKLVQNLNAEYLNGEKADEFARRKANENITGSWKFLSDCVSEGKWEFNKTVTFNSDIISSGNIQSPIFTSGFSGVGWKLDGTTNTLTIDNLIVRKLMHVYELVINKISATNGSLWISNSSKIDSVYTVSRYDEEFSKYFTFTLNGRLYLFYVKDNGQLDELLTTTSLNNIILSIISSINNGTENNYSKIIIGYDIDTELNKEMYYVEVQDGALVNIQIYNKYFSNGKLYVINTDQDEYSTLKVGDIVRCQKFQDNSIKYYDALIYAELETNKYVIQVSPSVLDMYSEIEYAPNGSLASITDKENTVLYNKTRYEEQNDKNSEYFQTKLTQPFEDDDLVQIGNIQNPNRQGALYLTATDDCGPYVEVLDGINRPDYSVLKKVPIFITALYKNKQYYVSKQSTIVCGNTFTGINIGKYTIDENNNIVKSDKGTVLYGYELPLNGCLVELENSTVKWQYANPSKVRLGNLSGIYNQKFEDKQPQGYGLYGENVYLTGEFYLNNGKSVVEFGEEQIMLKYEDAGMWIGKDENGDPKIQFRSDIIDLNFDLSSDGPTSKVLFEDGTMKFYHKATEDDLAKIDTSVGDIKQEGDTVWVKSIYLGYGVPNADDDEPLPPEPLLIFCDYNGRDLYNLGPSGMFKTQIQSPTVFKKSIDGIRLTGDYLVNGNSITINGKFDTINYFYITEGNNDIQKRFGIAIRYQDGTIKVKTIKMIASSMCFSYVSGESADGNPPELVFDNNLSAETLPSFVNYRKEALTAKSIWFPASLNQDLFQTGKGLFEYELFNIQVNELSDPDTGSISYTGTYSQYNTETDPEYNKQYARFWRFINNDVALTNNDIVNSAITLLKNLFNNTLGKTAYTYTINNKGEVEGAVYSPIYHSTVTETSDVVWDLAYSIFKNLVTKEDGSWAIDQISSQVLVENDSILQSSTDIPKTKVSEVVGGDSIPVYYKSHVMSLSKYFIDNTITTEGTTATQTKTGTNILDVSLTSTGTEFTFQIDNSTQNKYLFYK